MNKDVQFELTADGSYTLYVPSLDEHYHSVNGAIQESLHVFINAGLDQSAKNHINILEVGFGTGLNAYLTFLYAKQNNKSINYTGIELYPLPIEFIKKLNYTESYQDIYEKLHQAEWEQETAISPSFYLTKKNTDLTRLDLQPDKSFDLIYFDAFAPDKQPEMWTQAIFDFLFANTNQGGILTTYCAKGAVRRMLQQSGYKVERIPGPKGKREMLRAIKATM